MTISSTTNRVSFSGNGVTTAFSFPYLFLDDSDLVVVLRDSTGTETTKTLTTHYTVTGEGVQAGGTVTMLTAPATGETLVIYRDPSLTQDLDLVENDSLPVESLEQRLDKLTMFCQRLKDRVDRSIVLKETDSASNLQLPLLADRSGQFLSFDGTGTPIAVNALSGTLTATAYIQTLLDDGSASVARGTLGFTGAGASVPTALIEDLAVTDAKVGNSAKFQSPSQFTGTVIPSVGSNALTIAVKDIDGSDPSSTSPVYCSFGSSTLTSGDYNRRSISAALSAVISNGSTLGLTSAVEDTIQVYLLDNAGTPEICYHGGNAVLGEDALHTTTAEGGAGGADTRYTLYSTTARSNVRIRHIATLKGTWTSGAYAAVPTSVSLNTGRTPKAQRHEVVATGTLGHGTTNTKIRRFSSVVTTGTAITASDTSAQGYSFLINEEGLYGITYSDKQGAGADQFGVSLNAAGGDFTTAFYSIAPTTRQLIGTQSGTALNATAATVARLLPGDVLRAHDNGSCDSINVTFRVVKIAD